MKKNDVNVNAMILNHIQKIPSTKEIIIHLL